MLEPWVKLKHTKCELRYFINFLNIAWVRAVIPLQSPNLRYIYLVSYIHDFYCEDCKNDKISSKFMVKMLGRTTPKFSTKTEAKSPHIYLTRHMHYFYHEISS